MLHKISNKILMYIGTSAYAIAFLLMALNRMKDSYWAFYFPALILDVVGADLEFNVANVTLKFYTTCSAPITNVL